MGARRVRVALPWLQAALAEASARGASPAMESLCWLAGRGRIVAGASFPWREWLLASLGEPGVSALQRWPAGPCVAALSGLAGTPGAGSWCVAMPVHLAPGLDHLRLAPLAQAALDDQDASELGATVRSHFGGEAFSLHGFTAGAWLLRFNKVITCATQPPDAAVGHNVHDFMPSGPDGARIRSQMNEIQMLLHEHPVNERRVRARKLPVNAWWLWGFGETPQDSQVMDCAQWDLRTDDAWLRGLWHAQSAEAGPDSATVSEPLRRDCLIAFSQPTAGPGEESLAAVDAGLLSWLRAQVRSGAIERLDLLAGDVAVQVDSTARFRFWRRPAALADLLP
jgi:hypothetical protein